MSAAVEVLAIETFDRASHKATAVLRVGAFVLYGVKLIEQFPGSYYLALPQAPQRKGGTGWRAVVDITSPRLLDAMRDAVVAARQGQAS
jgi:hypothetical protein